MSRFKSFGFRVWGLEFRVWGHCSHASVGYHMVRPARDLGWDVLFDDS